jgi:hypothetical protein
MQAEFDYQIIQQQVYLSECSANYYAMHQQKSHPLGGLSLINYVSYFFLLALLLPFILSTSKPRFLAISSNLA